MTKLIIQIPAYNEASELPASLAALPRTVPGVDEVEWLVVDDGSTDGTAAVASRCGADHVVRLGAHRGLAQAFAAGLDACVRRGADVIVNTDADNQYDAAEIPALIAPVLDGRADLVVGDRRVRFVRHFPGWKRGLQQVGSWIVRRASNAAVRDTTSGFRAYSRRVAARLRVTSTFSYTLETLFQAGHEGLSIANVPVRTRPTRRPSRLAPTAIHYLLRSAVTIMRSFVRYHPRGVALALGSGGVGLGLLLAAAGSTGHPLPTWSVRAVLVFLGALLATLGSQAAVAALAPLSRRTRPPG